MEWIVGIIAAFVIAMLGDVIVRAATGNGDTGAGAGAVIFIIVYFCFGLAVEMPLGSYIKVENNKVVETKIRYIVAWNAEPKHVEYSSGVRIANLIYSAAGQSPMVQSLKYQIQYRVRDENLEAAQLYYDKVIKSGGDTEDIVKEAARIAQQKMVPGADAFNQIREIFGRHLKEHGIMLVGIVILFE